MPGIAFVGVFPISRAAPPVPFHIPAGSRLLYVCHPLSDPFDPYQQAISRFSLFLVSFRSPFPAFWANSRRSTLVLRTASLFQFSLLEGQLVALFLSFLFTIFSFFSG
ncbi:hypothetical protein QBC36DRAFT_66577 [Triangularia setosa]|uniref:Uncharacterized protein n=1 Tax=Triangularia setosa TaxID=2587417 RepID=A0AAN6WK64_9PEZI|nr:hypothetical protein QBC36DRAFT_66577 [Podospora setosa]